MTGERRASAIVFVGMGSAPRRIYLDPNAMLRDIQAQFPGAPVNLEDDRHTGPSVVVEGIRSREFGMEWTGTQRFAFSVVPIVDPENWPVAE